MNEHALDLVVGDGEQDRGVGMSAAKDQAQGVPPGRGETRLVSCSFLFSFGLL